MEDLPQGSQQQQWCQGPSTPGCPPTLSPAFPPSPSHWLQQGLCPGPWAACWLTPSGQWRFTQSMRTSSGTTRVPGMSSSYMEQLKDMSLLVRAWQNVVHSRRECKSHQYSCLENPMNTMKRQKDMTPEDEPPRSVGVQNGTGKEQRNSSTKNEEAGIKQKRHSLWMCLVVKKSPIL